MRDIYIKEPENKVYRKKAVILGGGLTGLVVAEQLQWSGFDVTLLEKNNHVGGMCMTRTRSTKFGKVSYDLGPHKFASFDQKAIDYFIHIMKHFIMVHKSSHIYLKGNHLKYPVSMVEIFQKFPLMGLRCGVGFSLAKLRSDGNTYEKYMKKRFGGYVYDTIFRGYAIKVWGDPKHLDAQLAKTRMVASSLFDMLLDMVSGSKSQSFAKFFYCANGIGQFIHKIAHKAEKDGTKVYLNAKDISIKGKTVVFNYDGKKHEIESDVIISTIQPADLSAILSIPMEEELECLKYRHLDLHYYLFDKNKVNFTDTWRFFPEEEIIFNRLSNNWSPVMAPDGKVCICAETTIPGTSKKDIDSKVIEYFSVTNTDILESWSDEIKSAYPVYHVGFKNDVEDVLDTFESFGIYCIGRQACHNYNNMDHCILEAIDLAKMIKEGKSVEQWRDHTKLYDWRIID